MKLSDNMKHILRNIHRGRPTMAGIWGRSAQGASQATVQALKKRGLILLNPRALESVDQPAYVLTAAGRELCAQIDPIRAEA